MGSYIYISQHIPGCGGDLFRLACLNYFSEIYEFPPSRAHPPIVWEAFVGSTPDLMSLPPDTMISGHFVLDGVRPHDRYARAIEDGRVRIITLVRDPLQRTISHYYFALQHGRGLDISIERRLNTIRNPISKYLGFQGGDAKEFLESYFLVGLMEHLQESIDLLAHSLGRAPVEAPKGDLSNDEGSRGICPEAIAKFKENNQVDYALYDAAVALFKEKYRKECGREC